jgi:hypothetical protein
MGSEGESLASQTRMVGRFVPGLSPRATLVMKGSPVRVRASALSVGLASPPHDRLHLSVRGYTACTSVRWRLAYDPHGWPAPSSRTRSSAFLADARSTATTGYSPRRPPRRASREVPTRRVRLLGTAMVLVCLCRRLASTRTTADRPKPPGSRAIRPLFWGLGHTPWCRVSLSGTHAVGALAVNGLALGGPSR